MKLQKHFIRLFALLFLALSLTLTHLAVAQQDKDKTEKKGLILFDFPELLEAKVEVNLTAKLINLVSKSVSNQPDVAELIQMLDGIYVRTYDRTIIDEKKLVNHFQQRLKEEKWEVLVKIKEENEIVEISLLFDEDTVYGIFVIVLPETSGEVTFVNIVGEIAPERIEELLGSLSNFGAIDIDVGGTLKAQAEPMRNTVQREIHAVKVENPPTLDAKLDDACWKIAPQADNFTHVRTGNPVEDNSKVKLVYTDEAIYVGWHLYDSRPDKTVVRQTQDHARFGKTTEDWVSFSIDPFHTHQFSNRTFFMANPLGKKYVYSPKRESKKIEWIEQWNVAANIVEDGWVVEMEIPWEMLDYPDTTEPIRMGINFDRGQARTNEHSWWSNIGTQEFYKNDGHWLKVLPPPKSSRMEGLLDSLEADKYSVPRILEHNNNISFTSGNNISFTSGDNISFTSGDTFRPVNASGLNRIDGLRLGGGFETGKQWHLDPLFFPGAGATIRKNENRTITLTDMNKNDSGTRYLTAPSPFLFGTMSYAFSSQSLNYRAGGGITSGENLNLTYGAQIHRLTSVRDTDILLSDSEQFLRALWGTDFQDYYLREGAVMTLQWQPMNITHSLGLFLLWEEHKSLENRMHFHLRNWSTNPSLAPQRNAPIHDGSMRSISFKYDFDTRGETDVKYNFENRKNTGEWYNTFLVEHASPAISSDFDFTRFLIHLRHYCPIGEDRIDTRLKVGIATDPLPFQRQFVVGGIGTLRGYSLYEFVGNHGFLFNLEYVHSLGNDAFIVPFMDIGQAWYHLRDVKHIQPKINLGIGFQGGPFRLNLAKPLEEERGYQVDFKWSRMF